MNVFLIEQCCSPGPWADTGSSSSRPCSCRKEHQELVRQGPQDQSDLSYSKSFQSRRHSKMPDRRMLGARLGHRDYSASIKTRNGN